MADIGDVRLAQAGDRAAFSRLHARYHRRVFLDLVARVRRREDAEDALQQAFLTAWAQLPRLREAKRFVPWLFRIARNKARDNARRERLRLVRHLDENADLVAPRGDEPPEIEILKELMVGMREETRSILFLRAVEGWSAEEIAAARRTSASTVRRRYKKAIAHLRGQLSRRLHDEKERDEQPDPGRRTDHRASL